MSLMGRPLPTANAGFPEAPFTCQLSGGEIAHPDVAGRCIAADPSLAEQKRRTTVERFDSLSDNLQVLRRELDTVQSDQ